jgi:hypothetical protein
MYLYAYGCDDGVLKACQVGYGMVSWLQDQGWCRRFGNMFLYHETSFPHVVLPLS